MSLTSLNKSDTSLSDVPARVMAETRLSKRIGILRYLGDDDGDDDEDDDGSDGRVVERMQNP